jgi:hypothetical protein
MKNNWFFPPQPKGAGDQKFGFFKKFGPFFRGFPVKNFPCIILNVGIKYFRFGKYPIRRNYDE